MQHTRTHTQSATDGGAAVSVSRPDILPAVTVTTGSRMAASLSGGARFSPAGEFITHHCFSSPEEGFRTFTVGAQKIIGSNHDWIRPWPPAHGLRRLIVIGVTVRV